MEIKILYITFHHDNFEKILTTNRQQKKPIISDLKFFKKQRNNIHNISKTISFDML